MTGRRQDLRGLEGTVCAESAVCFKFPRHAIAPVAKVRARAWLTQGRAGNRAPAPKR